MANVPAHITKFFEENFPDDADLAAYVICIARRDKTFVVKQAYDSAEVRDKVGARLAEEVAKWVPRSP
jgi:hypothetical protein